MVETEEKDRERSLTIAALVCPNGLGHFKRTVGLLGALQNSNPLLNIHLICSEWQVDRLQDWPTLRCLQGSHCQFHFGITEPGITWDPESVPAQLNTWHRQLQSLPVLKTADLVLSDNLVEILEFRPDAVLLGSFLWMDVFAAAFPGHQAVGRYIERNRRLLEGNRPSMIAVGTIAMPSLRKWTKLVPMPWFGQKPKRDVRTSRSGRAAVLMGATTAAQTPLRSLLKYLLQLPQCQEIALPPRTITAEQLTSHRKIVPFQFAVDDYQACDLVFCRPGVGTITDCITANTPMAFFHEGNNPEMTHNARTLVAAGLAKELPHYFTAADVRKLLVDLYQDRQLEAERIKLSQVPVNGFEAAKNWIDNHRLLGI